MTTVKNKTADIIYNQMQQTTAKSVAKTTLMVMDAIQGEKVCNQALGIGAALICMLHQYGLNHVDVLGIADNMVYSDINNNILPDFKVIKTFMKNEWEIV